jgi:phosphoglycolate phosphatase-like HAD superfamily hydrolase
MKSSLCFQPVIVTVPAGFQEEEFVGAVAEPVDLARPCERRGADKGEVLVVGRRPADATISSRAGARGSLCQPQMSVYVLPGNVRKVILKPKELPYAPEAPPLSPY